LIQAAPDSQEDGVRTWIVPERIIPTEIQKDPASGASFGRAGIGKWIYSAWRIMENMVKEEILASGLTPPGIDTTRVRKRPVRHPELEFALFEWVKNQYLLQEQRGRTMWLQEQGKPRQASGADNNDYEDDNVSGQATVKEITGPVLIREARRIAKEMDIRDTVFCAGWLSRFKARFRIKPFSSRSTASSVIAKRRRQRGQSSQHPQEPIISRPAQISSASSISPTMTTTARADISDLTPASPRSISLSTASTCVSSPVINSDLSMKGVIDKDNVSLMDVRPSIAVPAIINNSQTPLHEFMDHHHQQQQQQHRAFQKPQCDPSGDSQYQLAAHHQRIRSPYQHGSNLLPSYQGPHIYHASFPNTLHQQSTASTIHLEYLQNIPIARHSTHPSSFIPSPPPLEVLLNSSSPSSSSSALKTSQNLREAQQLVQQLRQYVRLHLSDPAIALQALTALDRELQMSESSRIRESIVIAEIDDDDDINNAQ
ncbi:hypothetical protein BX616_006451, partial [Lobosporangium transversale]